MTLRQIAIIGLGAVSQAHLAAYRAIEGIRIAAVVEPIAARRQQVAAELDTPGFASVEAMLQAMRPEIACVLTPAPTHAPIAEALAEAGVHILCEKPIALTLEDVARMRRACTGHGVAFYYGSSYRFLPALVEARRLIASGAIGDVRLLSEAVVTGQGRSAYRKMAPAHHPAGGPGGGEMGLVDHGIHLLDIFPWLTGSPLVSAIGRGNVSGEPHGPEWVAMTLANGATGLLTYDEATFPADLPWEGAFSAGEVWKNGVGFSGRGGERVPGAGSIRVHGSAGALRIFHYAGKLVMTTADGQHDIEIRGPAAPYHFAEQLRSFIRAIDDDIRPAAGLDDGEAALRALLAVYESQGAVAGQGAV